MAFCYDCIDIALAIATNIVDYSAIFAIGMPPLMWYVVIMATPGLSCVP